MLILTYFCIATFVVPWICAIAPAVLQNTMVVVIILAGIVMLFGAVGMKISTNLGSTIIGGIFRGIGVIFKAIGRAIRWIVRSIPRAYTNSHRIFTGWGINPVGARLLAIFALLLYI